MIWWRSRSRLSAANVFGGIGSPSGVRKVPRRSVAALSFGLKLRIPSRMNAALSRVIMRLASPTSVSRSRLGRLASSSASVGTATILQCPRSPRSQPRKPRFRSSVSSRSVFARRCSRVTATLDA